MAFELAFEEFVRRIPPVVVLHGLFGSAINWRSIARSLSATHRVLTVDLRSHGASPWSESMRYVDMSDDVLALASRLGLHRPAVIGHSMGGKVAMTLALRHPEVVGALVVVDIAPVVYEDRFSGYVQAMRSVDLEGAGSRTDISRRLATSIPDAGTVAFLMQNLVTRNAHFDWRLNLMAIGGAMRELTAFPTEVLGEHFDGPMTLIAGEHSDYVKPGDEQLLEAGCSRSFSWSSSRAPATGCTPTSRRRSSRPCCPPSVRSGDVDSRFDGLPRSIGSRRPCKIRGRRAWCFVVAADRVIAMLKILKVTAPIYLLIALGFVAVRRRWMDAADIRPLGRFVAWFGLPALLFRAIASQPISTILDGRYLVVYAVGSVASMLAIRSSRAPCGIDPRLWHRSRVLPSLNARHDCLLGRRWMYLWLHPALFLAWTAPPPTLGEPSVRPSTGGPPALNGWNEAHLSLTTTLPFARPAST